MKKQIFIICILGVFFLLSSTCLAADRLVPSQYSTIQDAINACNTGDTVIIAEGTYTGTGNYDLDFSGKAITVRSINPEDPCVAAATIINCQNNGRGFYFHSVEGPNSVISGLTIQNGYVRGDPATGGAILCSGASPTISNSIISNNAAHGDNSPYIPDEGSIDGRPGYGGGICCQQANPLIINCQISNNTAQGGDGPGGHPFGGPADGGVGCGGGIYSDTNSNSTIKNCIISDNNALGGEGGTFPMGAGEGGESFGGGIYKGANGNGVIKNCLLIDNKSTGGAGNMYFMPGQSYATDGGNAYGGAIYCDSNGTLVIANCSIANNIALGGPPGGIADNVGNDGLPYGGGIYCQANSGTTIKDSIIWDNDTNIDGIADVNYSDVEDGYAGTGNINADPCFTAGPLGNYYLSLVASGQTGNSPCINAGSDTAANLGMDELTTQSNQTKDYGIVNMGYHYQTVSDSPDIDESLFVDFYDFAILANDWLLYSEPNDPNLPAGDFTRSLHVDFKDLLILADAWLNCFAEPASSPSPVSGATYLDPNVILSWAPGTGIPEHDVYFGTDINAVAMADHLSEEFMDTVSDVNFGPILLDANVIYYYWRIDEVGPKCITKGNIWNFKTLATDPLLEGLISYWKFDEGSGTIANDSAGDNNGTVYGATWIAGQVNGALNIDYYNEYIGVPDDDNSLDMDNQITIAAWIKVENFNENRFIVTKQPSGTAGNNYPGNYEFRVAQTHGHLQFLHQTTTDTTPLATYASALPITAGVWQHVAVTLKKGAVVKFYINGSPAGTSLQTETFGIVNDEPVRIAIRKDAVTHFNGAVDDVRIYNRVLSSTEIQQLYINIAPIPGKASNPVPGNDYRNLDPNVLLSWTAGYSVDSHDVYFGTDFNDVNNADTSSPEFKGNQTATNYDPCDLEINTTYFWRIDEKNAYGTTKGDVWKFDTFIVEIDPNCVAWWTFDEGNGTIAYDSAGNNNGTIYGAEWTTGGQINGALDFDGYQDYVLVPDNDNSLDINNQITITAWVALWNFNKHRFIVTKQPSGTAGDGYPGNYEFRITQNDGYLQFLHQTTTDSTLATYTSTLPVPTGAWQHVAVTLEEGVAVKFYINGAPAGISPQTETFGIVNDEPVRIGARKDYLPYSFNRLMDDVRIYNRALSGTEIQQLYNDGLNP